MLFPTPLLRREIRMDVHVQQEKFVLEILRHCEPSRWLQQCDGGCSGSDQYEQILTIAAMIRYLLPHSHHQTSCVDQGYIHWMEHCLWV